MLNFKLFKTKKKEPEAAMPKTGEIRPAKDAGSKYNIVAKEVNPSLVGINLVSGEAPLKYPNQAGAAVKIILAIAAPALIIYGLSQIIGFYQDKVDKQLLAQQARVEQLKDELKSYEGLAEKNSVLKDKLLALKKLLDEHIYWSNFFALLEKYTLDGVYFSGLNADTSGSFVLPASAGSYLKAAQQLIAFKQAKDFIKEARVDNIKLSTSDSEGITGVSFELKVILADKVFKKIIK